MSSGYGNSPWGSVWGDPTPDDISDYVLGSVHVTPLCAAAGIACRSYALPTSMACAGTLTIATITNNTYEESL